jgi:hypothetical protein
MAEATAIEVACARMMLRLVEPMVAELRQIAEGPAPPFDASARLVEAIRAVVGEPKVLGEAPALVQPRRKAKSKADRPPRRGTALIDFEGEPRSFAQVAKALSTTPQRVRRYHLAGRLPVLVAMQKGGRETATKPPAKRNGRGEAKADDGHAVMVVAMDEKIDKPEPAPKQKKRYDGRITAGQSVLRGPPAQKVADEPPMPAPAWVMAATPATIVDGQSIAQWAASANLSTGCVLSRLRSGWDLHSSLAPMTRIERRPISTEEAWRRGSEV